MPMQSTAAGPPSGVSPAGDGQRAAGLRGTSPGILLRRHWLFAVLLVAGLALRAAAQIAYRPALLYIDSIKYLYGAYPGNDPPGYQLALKVFLTVGSLPMLAAAQHLAGLAMAAALYVLLLRRGVPRWLAAVAAAPVLLDAYQLQIEQSVMPDTAFEVLIVTGLALLLWQPRPRPWMIVAAGLALGACAPVRQVGEILLLPAVIFVLIVVPGWRHKLRQATVLCVAFALPIAAISFRNYVSIRHFSLAPYAASTIYGRVAAAADCQTLTLPGYERPLCPTRQEQTLGPDRLDHDARSPIKRFHPPPGVHSYQVVSNFSHRVILQQPLRVTAAIAKDSVKLFAVARVTSPGDTSIARWQFQPSYPFYPPYITRQDGRLRFIYFTPEGQEKLLAVGQPFGGGEPAVSRPLASLLRGYQLGGGYTPGPFLLVALLAGLAGSLALLRRRSTQASRDLAAACLLTFLAGVAVLLASDTFEFSWRYQLPALVTLPPAGALGVTVVIGYFAARRRRTAGQQVPRQAPRPSSAPGQDRRGPHEKDTASAS